MQIFIHGTETHVVQVTGTETVEDVKVGMQNYLMRNFNISQMLTTNLLLVL